jgi:hypothetical protein
MSLIFYKGRTKVVLATVTGGVPSWTDILTKFIAVKNDEAKTIVSNKSGTVNPAEGTLLFNFLFAESAALDIGKLNYEIVIYKADKSYVKTAFKGVMTVNDTIITDPTL